MDLARKMTRVEFNELSDVDKKERKRLKQIIATKKYIDNNPEYNKKYYQENKEKIADINKEYRDNNPDKVKEINKKYRETPNGKKIYMLAKWKNRGIDETDEELDIIYELYLHQEFCYSCDVKLTRDVVCSTQACLDHDHITNRFRQIACRSCNTNDSWMKYWC